jgi:hypothetical protein
LWTLIKQAGLGDLAAGAVVFRFFLHLQVRSCYLFQVTEWYDRAAKFNELADRVNKLAMRLNDVPNRELLYEIYPYIWDIRGVVSMLNSYVKWLGNK